MTETIEHNFNGVTIQQRASDGYVDLTAMAQAPSNKTGKRLGNFLALKSTKEYLKAWQKVNTEIQCLVTVQGFQGRTWAHLDLAIKFAAYLSPEFEVWCNRALRQVLQGELVAITPAATNTITQLNSALQEAFLDAGMYKDQVLNLMQSLGEERRKRLESLSFTLNALHSQNSTDEIEKLVAQLRKEVREMIAKSDSDPKQIA